MNRGELLNIETDGSFYYFSVPGDKYKILIFDEVISGTGLCLSLQSIKKSMDLL